MRIARFALVAIAGFGLFAPGLIAQEKPNPASKTAAATLKISVLFSENEADKKVANLPYSFFVRAGELGPSSPWTKLRMGSRVPVATGTNASSGTGAAITPLAQFQYIDVGTNIDARALTADEGRYELTLNLERSWVEGDVLLPADAPASPSATSSTHQFREPIIRQFKTELALSMHDGQSIQSTQATDPVSGRVLTVTVTMTVMK
jgi:hypothetical protein